MSTLEQKLQRGENHQPSSQRTAPLTNTSMVVVSRSVRERKALSAHTMTLLMSPVSFSGDIRLMNWRAVPERHQLRDPQNLKSKRDARQMSEASCSCRPCMQSTSAPSSWIWPHGWRSLRLSNHTVCACSHTARDELESDIRKGVHLIHARHSDGVLPFYRSK